jgi:DNA helicase-2/ATP-dependent DNA helicase PcrA
VALVLDSLNVPHTPLSGQHLFQTQVGKDVYSYLQVMLSPSTSTHAEFERILKRPNKYFTNQLIAQVRDWNSFQRLPQTSNLRDWEKQKLSDFIARIEIFSKLAHDPETSPVGFMQALKLDVGLLEFYRDRARLSDDLDQAGDEDLLEVIIALSENFKSLEDFYNFVCKSIDDNEMDSQSNAKTTDNDKKDEVYLGTIHRAKGKEFQNVVYFNLSKTSSKSGKEAVEEERRVAYVGATRPKDSLLITFPAAKPSAFLSEISLNPKFEGIPEDDLERRSTSTKLRLKNERTKLEQFKLYRDKLITQFDALTEIRANQNPSLFVRLAWVISNWRIRKTQKKIEYMNIRIRKLVETVIDPLLLDLSDLEEEMGLRNALKKI